MIIQAELRLDVKCTLDDKIAIPNYITFSCGEPDENNIIEYAASSFVNEKQLEEIYDILMKTQKNIYSSRTMKKILNDPERIYKHNKTCLKCHYSFINGGGCRYRLRTEGCSGFKPMEAKE